MANIHQGHGVEVSTWVSITLVKYGRCLKPSSCEKATAQQNVELEIRFAGESSQRRRRS